ncbi:MAG: UvrD-helicase domain-containing protein [Acidobacteria bacterium]|nr:UvrD-helicase domain-containing protein [Acidobacteriota bacterium]
MKPTPSQVSAIETSTQGDVCVVAGPGSGKTAVLVERFRWLVSEKGLRPDEIAAITFTDKAAANMLERLVARAEPERRRAYQMARISTIHAFCAGLLREHALEAGLDPAFEVTDAGEAEIQLQQSIATVLDRGYRADPERVLEFLKNFHGAGTYAEGPQLSSVHKEVASLYHALREWGKRPDEDGDEGFSTVQREGRAWLIETLRQVDRDYYEAKRAHGHLDFSDLQQETIDLIEGSATIRFPFQAILVDEYQDTNHLQKRLLELIQERSGNGSCRLFVVGDLNQAIYGFRHADPEIFRDLRTKVQEGDGTVVELLDNFRSRAEVLRAVDVMFHRTGECGVESRALTAAREFPAKQEPCIEVIVARTSRDGNPKELEAWLIADRIHSLRESLRIGKEGRPASWKDFAILVRARSIINDITPVLRAAGVPYKQAAGGGFFDTPEVRDLLNFLRSARNPRDEVALAAYLLSPFAGLSADGLFELKRLSGYGNLGTALWVVEPNNLPDSRRITKARELLNLFRMQRDSVAPHVLISRLISETGFEAYLAQSDDGDVKVANARKFLGMIRRLSNQGRLSFDELVGRLDELQQSAPQEPEADVARDDINAVSLMTIHTAKGLEFPVVILPSLQWARPGHKSETLYDPALGIGARWASPGAKEPEEDPAYKSISERRKKREEAESDRLLYVAMTRAEEHLVLTTAFKERVSARGWSKNLRDQLGIDFRAITNAWQVDETWGVAVRSLVTGEHPALASAAPATDLPLPDSNILSIDPAGAAEQADSAAAATSIALFGKCPRRYYLSRYLGFQSEHKKVFSPTEDDEVAEASTEMEATDLGQRVHEILAGSRLRDGEASEVLELVRRFEESNLGRRAAGAANAVREENLVFAIEGHLVRAQIDLWFDDGAEQVLVDYKTDRLKPHEVEAAAQTYASQIQLYAMGIRQWLGRMPEQAVLHFLRPDIVVKVDLSTEALDEAKRLTEEFFTAQSNVAFPLKVDRHCFRCPYYQGLCPADVTTQTDQDSSGIEHESL